MALWNYDAVLKFIGLYQEEHVLWDPNHPKFEHEINSNRAWANVREDMGPRYKVEDLMLKMFSLQRMYLENKRRNTIPCSYVEKYFLKLDSFLGKTSTYITMANSTQVQKIEDIERVKVALDQKLSDTTKDLATAKDDVKELTQQVANLQLENNTLREEVQKIEDIERVKVALDQKLRDTTKDLATAKDDVKELTQQVANLQLENNTLKEEVQKIEDIERVKVALDQKLRDKTKDLATAKDDVKELTQQVVNLQLENHTPREEVEKIGDIEGVKVALDEKLRDISKDLATTKDDVKELTQQVVNLQLENHTPREEVEKIGDIEGVKVALDEKLRDITKDLATTKDDVKELTQQVVNLQLENHTPREEVEKIGDIEGFKVALDEKLRDITKDLATTKDDVKELTQQVVNLQLENNTPREEVQKIGDTEDVKVKDAGVPQQEDVCGLYAKLLAEKFRRLPERKRLNLMHEVDGMVLRHLDVE